MNAAIMTIAKLAAIKAVKREIQARGSHGILLPYELILRSWKHKGNRAFTSAQTKALSALGHAPDWQELF
jgi:hypothetical protein